jgi:hypothetical protein
MFMLVDFHPPYNKEDFEGIPKDVLSLMLGMINPDTKSRLSAEQVDTKAKNILKFGFLETEKKSPKVKHKYPEPKSVISMSITSFDDMLSTLSVEESNKDKDKDDEKSKHRYFDIPGVELVSKYPLEVVKASCYESRKKYYSPQVVKPGTLMGTYSPGESLNDRIFEFRCICCWKRRCKPHGKPYLHPDGTTRVNLYCIECGPDRVCGETIL